MRPGRLLSGRWQRPAATSSQWRSQFRILNGHLWFQVSYIRESLRELLEGVAECVQELFHEQGITISSILTTVGLAISTLVVTLTGRRTAAARPAPP